MNLAGERRGWPSTQRVADMPDAATTLNFESMETR